VEKRETSVFFSYAHKDKPLRDRLEEHLSILKYRGLITTWHDREITAGDDWEREISRHLESASIVLLLISASFMASQYCYSIEMRRALERHKRGEARVIPVLLRPVLFTGAPFASLQLLPSDGKPVVTHRDRDKAFVDVALGIERALQQHEETGSSSNIKSVPPASWQLLPPREETQPSGAISPPLPLPAPARRQKWHPIALIAVTLLILISIGGLFAYQSFSSRNAVATPTPAATLTLVPTGTPIPPPVLGVSPIVIVSLIIPGVVLIMLLIVLAIGMVLRRRAKRRSEGMQRREREQAYYQQALVAYEQALQRDPSDAEALKGKGIALEALERYNEALGVLQQFATVTPDSFSYTRMGDIFMKMNQTQEALTAYEQATNYDEQYALAFHGMGQALKRLGKVNESERAFEKAKQLGYED